MMKCKQFKAMQPMERELNYLLVDLCVIWGFCISANDRIGISKSVYYTSENFAKDVVEAEGMNPESEIEWVKKISTKFNERFGNDEIDKSTFIGRVREQKENW